MPITIKDNFNTKIDNIIDNEVIDNVNCDNLAKTFTLPHKNASMTKKLL